MRTLVLVLMAATTSPDGGPATLPPPPVATISMPDGGVTVVPLVPLNAVDQQYFDTEEGLAGVDAGISVARVIIDYHGHVQQGPLWTLTPEKIVRLDEEIHPDGGLTDSNAFWYGAGIASGAGFVGFITLFALHPWKK